MRRRPPVRLTLRGRVVVAAICLLFCGAVNTASAPAIHATELTGQRTDEPVQQSEPEVVVVLPGDTLWSVVARHAPSADAYGIIEEVRQLNDLRGHTIHPGQELILP